METQSAAQRGTRVSAAARLDRLPIGSFHKGIMWIMAYIFFFELGDLNTFGFAAPAIRIAWKLPLSTIGFITSAAFIGMLVGLIISVFQSVTQIQEITLTFVPKIVVVMIAFLLFLPWMLGVLMGYVQPLLGGFADIVM